MALNETLLFYLLFGAGTATAVALRRDVNGATGRWFRIVTAIFFWPLYLPILLERPAGTDVDSGGEPTTDRPADNYAATIARVEAELETALDSLDGWAENVLAREQDRFAELRSAWRLQADRIRQLDRLLAATDPQHSPDPCSAEQQFAGNPRFRQSEQARHENLERLRAVRQRLHDDLLGTLAWVRELVSMIHLAKFTGAPASRADELVAQIATAVEGLSEVTQWRDEPVEIGRGG
ncbi:MAG TPA: hypothetical protein VGM05_13445 [Planctomycetaceae bacterium]